MRGEWIEMVRWRGCWTISASLPMRGEWIEIFSREGQGRVGESLSPCGESGLKFRPRVGVDIGAGSLPMRGEWIEIMAQPSTWAMRCVSPHAGRVD